MGGHDSITRKRARLLVLALSLVFLAVIYRLGDIMVLNHDWYLQKARGQQIRKETPPAKRGVIVDRRGRELAINLETESFFSDPAEISEPDATARTLATVLRTSASAIHPRLLGDNRFTWIERKVDIDTARKVSALHLRGVGTITEMKRFYPKGSLAAHVVGFVNTDNKGLEGIEKGLDKYLSAKEQSTYVVRDAKGNHLSQGSARDIKGNNVVLTIDEGLQHILEKNLDAAMQKWNAVSATAIMMDPATGEILALANRPTYDPGDMANVSQDEIRNRAITDCYEPGSTFKIVVGIAALEEGVVKPETRFDCSAGSVEVGGRRIKDAHRHGVLSFHEVIQKSSNVGTIKTAMLLGKSRVYEYVRKFGFGDKTGIDLQGEVSGLVKHVDRWSGMSIGAIAIGQEIGVTPLQILRAYAAVANGGFLVTPHVVKEIRTPEGEVLLQSPIKTERIISEETARAFREILKTVTEEGGTAREAAVEGNRVAGKTGTAQLIDPKTKRYSTTKFVSSFVGFVPADSPRIAMIVVVKEPKGAIYGGTVAGPVFRQIADQSLAYLSVPMDNATQKGLLLVSAQQE